VNDGGIGLSEGLAGPPPASPPALQITRVVCSQGGLMVAGAKIHRGKVVTVAIEDTSSASCTTGHNWPPIPAPSSRR
jgi:hypothetical protein